MTVLATATALLGSRYLTMDPETFLPEQRLVYLANLGPLMLHVAGAVVALVLGPWQFVRRLRVRYPAAHRFIGRVYLVSTLAAGVGGLLLAPKALGSPAGPLGFGTLAVLTLGTSTAAYVSIRRRQVARHRAWMTRSYALIFTGVTFRLWISGLPAVGLCSFDQAYRTGAFAAWMINLLVAELLIARTRTRTRATPPAPAHAPAETEVASSVT
jgi:uncharacterized membrane protein